MNILYLGSRYGASLLRSRALERLGHKVRLVDPSLGLPNIPFISILSFKLGNFGFESYINKYVLEQIEGLSFELIFVDIGSFVGVDLMKRLRDHSDKIINYNQDNPFTKRDGGRWYLFKKALPYYDLFITPRESNIEPAKRWGAKKVLRTFFASDEATHFVQELSHADKVRFASEVSFVGTWMPERGPFMLELVNQGVPLSIFGPRWERAKEYGVLKKYHKVGMMNPGDFAKAIAGSKICIALLSKGNEDLHTLRSLEIPAMGRLMCGERTKDHLALYEEGVEAFFFDDAQECARICKKLLQDDSLIQKVSKNGHERALKNMNFNEPNLKSIIEYAFT